MYTHKPDLLIQSAIIIDPASEFNGRQMDILIQNGLIALIASSIDPINIESIDLKGASVSPGWFDLHANFGEPGNETKEDMVSGTLAAMKGGFTGTALMPDTEPSLHSKSEIEYIRNKAKGLPIEIVPIGAISRHREGKELAELYDMWLSGARAFSDGDHPVQNAGLLLRAMQYAGDFGGLIMSNPEDLALTGGAKVNEGINSLLLGMKGIPAIAEELMVARDLLLAEYANCRIHFCAISTAGSVNQIKKARNSGIKVSVAVAAYHLLLDDSNLSKFDSNYKVKPPLRTNEDRLALIGGLIDGSIDVVCSQHIPHEAELKKVEFESAAYGMIGLETSYSLLNMALNGNHPELIVELLSINPRKILGLELPSINVGAPANLTWYNPEKEWILEKKDLGSKSSNSPWLGKKLMGKIYGAYVSEQLNLN